MGEAKRRGSYEQRRAASIARPGARVEQTGPSGPRRKEDGRMNLYLSIAWALEATRQRLFDKRDR